MFGLSRRLIVIVAVLIVIMLLLSMTKRNDSSQDWGDITGLTILDGPLPVAESRSKWIIWRYSEERWVAVDTSLFDCYALIPTGIRIDIKRDAPEGLRDFKHLLVTSDAHIGRDVPECPR